VKVEGEMGRMGQMGYGTVGADHRAARKRTADKPHSAGRPVVGPYRARLMAIKSADAQERVPPA